MTGHVILEQALQHIPALLLIFAVLFASYWLAGLIRWPAPARRDKVVEGIGSLDPATLDASRLSGLLMISFLSLFLELLLIRWVASEIRVFAYFKSLVLIACFLGFGLGCYLTQRRIRIAQALVPLVALAFLVELPWSPLRHLMSNLSGFIGWFSDVHVWGRAYFAGNPLWGFASALMALAVIIPLFGLIAVGFVPFGQMVGLYLERSQKGIAAYSLNVAASIAGIWVFTGLCFLSTPPVVWFGAAGVGMLLFFWRWPALRRSVAVGFGLMVALFFLGSGRQQWWGEESWKGWSPEAEHDLTPGPSKVLWSPYQKLTLVPLNKDGRPVRYIINTNDSWYQQMMDLSPGAVARDPALYDEGGIPVEFQQYNLPYRFYHDPPRRVLIAGGGSGNDAAAAVRNGAEKVTVVEIDPVIYHLGRELHFEHPYADPKVTVKVNDARSFLENDKGQYDLIVFSILDSHTTSSYYTNIRIDNYVYTVEAMRAARRLLAPDGLFVMSFSSERGWFNQRLVDVVTKAFGAPPLKVQGIMSFFVAGNPERIQRVLAEDPALRQFVSERPMTKLEPASLVTDDWPYLYQQTRGIPVIVWVLSFGLVLVSGLAFRGLKESTGGLQWHFFFLGAAFMLLEVQIISKVALLFGTTWLVNSIVISTVLLFILLANLIASRWPGFPKGIAYAGLFLSLAASYFIPTDQLFFQSWLVRGLVAMLLYCSPVFFAGLIFVSSFREVGFRAEAFGSNLLGSLVGGLLESASFAIGINALVLLAGGLYLASLLTMRRQEQTAASSQAVIAEG